MTSEAQNHITTRRLTIMFSLAARSRTKKTVRLHRRDSEATGALTKIARVKNIQGGP